MRRWWLRRGFAGAALIEVAAASYGFLPPLPADPQKALFGADHVGLRDWLRELVIDIPAGEKFAMMGLEEITLVGGSCSNMTVERLDHADNSSGTLLKFDLGLSGVGIRCHVDAQSDGTLTIDLVVAGSQLNASVQVHPMLIQAFPEMPLPFGHLNLSSCQSDLVVEDMVITGNSSLAQSIADFDRSLLASLVGGVVNEPLCDGLKVLVETRGTESVGLVPGILEPVLVPPPALPAPLRVQPPRPTVDWGAFPPVIVLKRLLAERFPLWGERIVQILNLHSFNAVLASTENVTLALRQLHIEGVGPSHRPGLSILGEGEDLGVAANLKDLTLEATLVLEVALPGQPVLVEAVLIKVGLDNATVRARALFDRSRFGPEVLDHEVSSPACLVQCAEGIVVPREDSIAVTELDISLRPVLEVTSFGEIERDVTGLANTLLHAVFDGYLPAVSALARGGLGLAREPITAQVWEVFNALPPCAEEPGLLGMDSGAIEGLPVVAMVIFVSGLGAAAAVRHAQLQGRIGPAGPASEVCLARTAAVPPALGALYPFAVVAVMFLFYYADLAVGAVVSLVMDADGQRTKMGPVFSFSLLSTIIDSLSSGSWVISVLTLLLSGLWPHVKLFLLLAAWLVPPCRFTRKARRRMLTFLDTWGKYSFLETWFLVFSMSAFAIEWHSVGEQSSLKVQTTPLAAFYVFFVATVLTLILGHVASECDARAGMEADPERPPSVSEAVADAGHSDVGDDMAVSEAASARSTVSTAPKETLRPLSRAYSGARRVAVAFGLLASFVLAILSAVLVSFNFTIDGIFIKFLLSEPINKSYSLLSVGQSVASDRYDDPGLVMLEACFFLLSFLTPLALLIALAVLWLAPLARHRQEALLHACRVLDNWACLDVAVLVLAIAILQFGIMAEFLVSKGSLATPCGLIKDLTEEGCLDIQMKARPGVSVLILAGLALLVVPKATMRACAAALAGGAKGAQEAAGITEVA